ncbi:aldo/keto reductase [Amycolatopsis sp. NBC_00345]|uniref:aldo/keto reductase n=1 Tax=Amycolatopsis sp. NBC_00345 TaxID=2975955 RepID=UPI002E261509
MNTVNVDQPVRRTSTFAIGGDLTVHRLGLGTMQLTGPGTWGPPRDRAEAIRVLRQAVELGVDFIDTADSYGPYVVEDLIREALHPYPDGLVIATKGGLARRGPAARDEGWPAIGRPDYLRHCVVTSLQRLGVDTIDLYHLHRVDPQVPIEDSLGELATLRQEGKIRHIGVSEVSLDVLRQAQAVTPIATVQNRYNLVVRHHDPVVEYCEREGIGFIPWFPLESGDLTTSGGTIARLAEKHQCTRAQLAISWLLARSPVMLPIPGTASTGHLTENLTAGSVVLTDEDVELLTRLS